MDYEELFELFESTYPDEVPEIASTKAIELNLRTLFEIEREAFCRGYEAAKVEAETPLDTRSANYIAKLMKKRAARQEQLSFAR